MAIDPADIALEESDSKGRYVYRAGERRGGDDLLQGRRAASSSSTTPRCRARSAARASGRRWWRARVADVRAAGKKILPLCPFAAAQFRRHPEWADLLQQRRSPA